MLKKIIRIAIVVELILLMGFIPTLFNPNARIYGGPGGGWDWSPWTFIGPMAGLMFIAGLAIDVAVSKIPNPMYRVVVVISLVIALGYIWARIVWSDEETHSTSQSSAMTNSMAQTSLAPRPLHVCRTFATRFTL